MNGETIQFENEIRFGTNGEIFVPMKEFFDYVSIQYSEFEDGTVLAFRDNIFLKFNYYSSTFSINGKELPWETPPMISGDLEYIDIGNLLHYFTMSVQYDPEKSTLYFTSNSSPQNLVSASSNLSNVYLAGNQISISIPYYWDQLSSDFFGQFGTQDTFSLETSTEPLSVQMTLPELVKKQKQELSSKDAEFFFEESRATKVTSYEVLGFKTIDKSEKDPSQEEVSTPLRNILYDYYTFFIIDDQFYTFHFHTNIIDTEYHKNAIDKIMNSIKNLGYSIDFNDEYYVEYPDFALHNTFIASKLHSNMMVSDYLFLKGTIDQSITQILVQVKKDRRMFETIIPVTDGQFTQNIALPFGLGVHQVSLSVLGDDIEQDSSFDMKKPNNMILSCSVINSSITELYTMISSRTITIDDDTINEIANSIDKSQSDYEKAKELLERIAKEFISGDYQDQDNVLETHEADSLGISRIYVALLRNQSIPARLVQLDETENYYVEFEYNGVWTLCSPAKILKQPQEPFENSFNLSRPPDEQITVLYE